jgi:hypothetical protein
LSTRVTDRVLTADEAVAMFDKWVATAKRDERDRILAIIDRIQPKPGHEKVDPEDICPDCVRSSLLSELRVQITREPVDFPMEGEDA